MNTPYRTNISVNDDGQKLVYLARIVQTVEGKVVVFANFTAEIEEAKKYLEDNTEFVCVSLLGKHDMATRNDALQSFYDGPAKVLLTTYGAGSTGYSFKEANVAVFLKTPMTVSPATRMQAEARIARIGQTRQVEFIDIEKGEF